MTPYYTQTTLAELLSVSTDTILRLRKTGLLPYHRIGGQVRFTFDDVETYLARVSFGADKKSHRSNLPSPASTI